MDSSFEIFTYSLATTLITFYTLRVLFYMTFRYRISRHFRRYSFFITIMINLLEVNLIYLALASTNNLQTAFSFKFQDKLCQVFCILTTFLVLLYSVGMSFLIKILYAKTFKKFYDQYENTTSSLVL